MVHIFSHISMTALSMSLVGFTLTHEASSDKFTYKEREDVQENRNTCSMLQFQHVLLDQWDIFRRILTALWTFHQSQQDEVFSITGDVWKLVIGRARSSRTGDLKSWEHWSPADPSHQGAHLLWGYKMVLDAKVSLLLLLCERKAQVF